MKRLKIGITLIALVIINFVIAWLLLQGFNNPAPSGERYAVVVGWPQAAATLQLGQVSGVGVDPRGEVYLFHRGARNWQGEPLGLETIQTPTVAVVDSVQGRLIRQWGADLFVMPHSLTVALDAAGETHLWLTDVGLHQVLAFDAAGKLLLTLGERGVAGADESHFNQPTDVAIAADGSIFVSDGYGNNRIVHFTASGHFLQAWGKQGSEPGEFDLPHSIAIDRAGKLYVADRGNSRLQIFDQQGKLFALWPRAQVGRPWAVRVDADGNVYVVDGGDQRSYLPDRARILKFDPNGALLAAFGAYGNESGAFIWPHTIAIDAAGSLYVGEVATGMRVQKFQR